MEAGVEGCDGLLFEMKSVVVRLLEVLPRHAIEFFVFFFFKQKTAYELTHSDWSSDVCSSDLDHAPHARYEKDVPFEEAPFGVTGLETAFSALFTRLVEPGMLSLAALIDRMGAGPARIYGLERPRIAVGAPANLVVLDLERT